MPLVSLANRRFLPAVTSAVLACLVAATAAAAQTTTAATEHVIASSVLREPRTVRVVLPPNYAVSTRRHPVLYVLDGDSNLTHAAEAVRLLAAHSRIPEMVVVGISHRRRNWELTTAPAPTWTYPAELGEVGGADRFLDALETDIMPWVDRTFRTAPHRVLLGHSLGGMVAWHALATRPALFRSYLIVDGSVFWNHGQVVDEVERALKSAAPPTARVFWVRDAIPHEVWFPENHRLKALKGRFADDRAAARPDWTVAEMDAYYAALSRAYGFEVVVPRAMMAMVGQGLTVAGRTSEVIVTGVSLILEPVFQHSETWPLTKTISLAIAALERRARPQRAPQP